MLKKPSLRLTVQIVLLMPETFFLTISKELSGSQAPSLFLLFAKIIDPKPSNTLLTTVVSKDKKPIHRNENKFHLCDIF